MRKLERMVWALLVASLAAWGMGRQSPSPAKARDNNGALPAKSSRQSAPEDAIARGGSPERRHAGAAARTRAALGQEDPLERLSKFLAVLSACDPAELAKVTRELDAMQAQGMLLPLEQKLLHYRAGQVMGSELLSQRSGSAQDRAELASIRDQYEGWLQADLGAASRWLETLPAGPFRDQLAITAISAAAPGDPAGSFLQAAALHPSQQKPAGQSVGSRLLESGSLEAASASFEAMSSAAGQADSGYLGAVFGSLLDSAVARDQTMAASLAEAHVHEPYASTASLSKVSARMAGSDPAAALEWSLKIEGLKGEAPGGGVAAAAVRGMDLAHLAAAEEWSAANADLPGVDQIVAELGRRRNALEDQGEDDGGYDRDD